MSNDNLNVVYDVRTLGKPRMLALGVQHMFAMFGAMVLKENTVFAIFENPDTSLIITSIVTIVPIAIATMMEHIGDIAAISSTVNRNYFENPGLHRTLFGDGLATLVASLFGAPANTTYGENTGVLTLSRVYAT